MRSIGAVVCVLKAHDHERCGGLSLAGLSLAPSRPYSAFTTVDLRTRAATCSFNAFGGAFNQPDPVPLHLPRRQRCSHSPFRCGRILG
jgi:hypothetical protein